MAITLKTSKQRMFSTVLDVVRRGRMIKTDTLNFVPENDPSYDSPIIDDGEIESYINHADGILIAYLNQLYGGEEGLRTDPWVTTPYRNPNNANTSKLIAVQLNEVEDIYTAFWTINFESPAGTTTSTTTTTPPTPEYTPIEYFLLTSSLEGSQGSGDTGSDMTSTNTEITIGSNAWLKSAGAFKINDKFYFSIIDSYPIINKLSADLAAAAILMELYSEAVPNANEYATRLYEDAMSILEKLADPESGLSLTITADYDISSTPVDYNISKLGEDKSDYLTENDLDV